MAIKSTAKAQALARDLKDKAKMRGYDVRIEYVQDWPKLIWNDGADDAMSLMIKGQDFGSKDALGLSAEAVGPHAAMLARYTASALAAEAKEEAIADLARAGMAKVEVREDATDLATAEAKAAPDYELRIKLQDPHAAM